MKYSCSFSRFYFLPQCPPPTQSSSSLLLFFQSILSSVYSHTFSYSSMLINPKLSSTSIFSSLFYLFIFVLEAVQVKHSKLISFFHLKFTPWSAFLNQKLRESWLFPFLLQNTQTISFTSWVSPEATHLYSSPLSCTNPSYFYLLADCVARVF